MGLFNFKEKIKKNWHQAVVIAAAIIFFLGTSSYNFFTQKPSFWWPEGEEFIKWISPDETANYVFSKLYAQEGRLYIYEKYNIAASDVIHPRSIRSDYGVLKPMSFIGMPILYGKIASFTSYQVIPYLTPFFAAIGIIFFYLFVRIIFGAQNALVSALILAVFPPYVYYSSRSMFHNIPFVVFLIISLYFGVKMIELGKDLPERARKLPNFNFSFSLKNFTQNDWRKIVYPVLSGIFFGLSVGFRTSELLWMGPMILIVWIFYFKRISVPSLLIFISSIILSLLPVFYWNQILFGSPINGGYPEMNNSIQTLALNGSAMVSSGVKSEFAIVRDSFEKIKSAIFHFGIDFSRSSMIFKGYFVKMFYWIFWPAIIGAALLFVRFWKVNRKYWAYLCAFLALSVLLVLYYGSWDFHDNPDKNAVTIGNSYTRYWLPMYLGAIPLAAYFINVAASLAKKSSIVEVSIKAAFISAISTVSIIYLLIGSDEGLIQTSLSNSSAREEYAQVIGSTQQNSILVTRYHDKLFFPERKIIVGLFDDMNMNMKYAELSGILPVYYYNFSLRQEDLAYLNASKFSKIGLWIDEIKRVNSKFTLYELSHRK